MGFSLRSLDPTRATRKLNKKVFGKNSGIADFFSSAGLPPGQGSLTSALADPKGTFKSVQTLVKNPSDTFRYLEDHGKRMDIDELPDWLSGNVGGLALTAGRKGQEEAAASKQNYGAFTDEDLYRMQTETNRPRDNPFEAQNYDAFSGVYGSRGKPRVYSTDTSFVYPTTEPVQATTGLIPSTGEPGYATGANAPVLPSTAGGKSATPAVGPTATGGDSVAKMFQVPTKKKPSVQQVM